MSHAVHREVHPPTGVDHAVSAYFTRPVGDGGDPNLVVASANRVTVYAVRRSNDDDGSDGAESLEVVSEFDAHGAIGSVAVLRRRFGAPRNQRDALLIAIRERKLAVAEYDASTGEVTTSSLHSFEGDVGCAAMEKTLRMSREAPLVVADPEGRCAAVVLRDDGCAGRVRVLASVDGGLGLVSADDEEGRVRGPAASVLESFALNVQAAGVRCIRDVCFLHGYAEPSLAILYEKTPTWAGRYNLAKDTCEIVALSVDVDKQKSTVIWRRQNLPSSSYKLTALLPPLGGVLVFSQDFLLHESQESSSALCLNTFGRGGPQEGNDAETVARLAGMGEDAVANPPPACAARAVDCGLEITLDGAQAAVVSEDRVLVTTKMGALFLLALHTDGRSLRRMMLQRAGGAVLSSGMCLLSRDLLFLGSRIGDSLLVKFTPKSEPAAPLMLPKGEDDEETVDEVEKGSGKRSKSGDGAAIRKRAKSTEDPPPAPSTPSPEDDDDELEALLYGTTKAESVIGDETTQTAEKKREGLAGVVPGLKVAGYDFKVKDSLLGVAPVVDITVGASAPVGTDTAERTELVTACGQGKNGALAILTRGVQPELVTEVEAGTLPTLQGLWALHDRKEGTREVREPFHNHLLLSMKSSTMIMETGEELQEVSASLEFITDQATLAAANFFGHFCSLQITETSIRILKSGMKVQDVTLADIKAPKGSVIASAEILDPYIMIRLSDGTLRLLAGDEKKMTVSLMESGAMPTSSVTAFALVDDSAQAADAAGGGAKKSGWIHRSATNGTITGLEGSKKSGASNQKEAIVAIAREGGSLELFSLPSCTRIWNADGLSEGSRVLSPTRPVHSELRIPEIVDIRIDSFEEAHERPLLTAVRGDGTLLLYRGFIVPAGTTCEGSEEPLARGELRFSRVNIDVEGSGLNVAGVGVAGQVRDSLAGTRLTRISNVGEGQGLQGIFVAGPNPLWLIVRRSRVLALPTRGEGEIVAFTDFHNVNCPYGFILGTAVGGVRICQMPSKMHYEAAWPVRKIALKCTPHAVAYLPDFKLYALVTSANVPWVDREIDGENVHGLSLSKARRERAKAHDDMELQYSVRLLVPGSLDCVWQHTLEPGEHVQCVRNVQLKDINTGHSLSYLAVGTAMPGGEDTPCRGRVYLFNMVWERDSESADGYRWKGQVCCVREAKMACTALEGLGGHLIVAVGTKLTVHTWDGRELNSVAFFDTPIHTVSINVVKNFILVGDLEKGLHFFRWKDTGFEKSLIQLSKDFERMDVVSSEFLIDGTTLSLLGSDMSGNARTFGYDPKSIESWKGQKLLPRAAYHVGSPISRMVRFNVEGSKSKMASTDGKPKGANRFAVFFGTLDGALGIFMPTDPVTYEKLLAIQRELTTAVRSPIGCNPRTFRTPKVFEGKHVQLRAPLDVLDGGLLSKFETLTFSEQVKIASSAQVDRDLTLGLIQQLSASNAFV
ncbi:Cleavage/polyadenylation specificity factor, A subunit, C-terminal [Ostreococcus tauri]|uniref:Cleavage/polyadenylation specificity factor, A subunit, C-terminal n=1 Tax=Ostreococcus tauri TaxID=70448 RepID=A0A090M2V1_OSTTA|nr:Cleavage/polyadenylation specificity factor, A subunit, C-terminal [Ostreococcus tauri]CEF98575.1 Cleavage/polyadenylation specificity factor, A subunit, C-terminal [Ostreococcus tauri]|eukprot:XP_022839345.1 Cleavage/polyadenylation specificity factor, A subunit, C-terminal [Ostreococcus tauri]